MSCVINVVNAHTTNTHIQKYTFCLSVCPQWIEETPTVHTRSYTSMQLLNTGRTETGRYADSQKKRSQVRRHVERQTDRRADMLRAPTGRQTDSCQPDRQLHRGRVVTLNQYTRLLSWNVLTYFCQIHLSVRTCIASCVRLLIEAHPGCV